MNKYLVFFTVLIVVNSCRENDEFKYISVSTTKIEYDNQTAAKFYGTVENKSVQTITESGFILSVRSQDNNGIKLTTSNPVEKSLAAQTTAPLLPNKTFYVRAYVVSQGATIYGNEQSFKTSGTTSLGSWNEIIFQTQNGSCGLVTSSFSLGEITYFATSDGLFGFNHLSKEFKLVLANNTTKFATFAFVYNGEAFLFSIDRFYKFNPVNNSLTALAQWPLTTGNRFSASRFVINDAAYIGLGEDNRSYVKDFWKYNIKANTWERVPDFPGDFRSGTFSFTLSGTGYTGGGYNLIKYPYPYFNDLWQFDPNTQKWKAKQSFPVTNTELSGLIGTENAGLGYGYYQKKLFEYNPFYDFWEAMTTLTTSKNLCYPYLFSYKGKVYLAELTGYSNSYTICMWSYEK